jgi:hypothetical integral membrane protein (TIGR02206 family)
MSATITPVSYWSSVVVAGALCVALCVAARWHPGRWTIDVARIIGVVLAADAISYTVALVVQGTWSVTTSLPLALCNLGVVVAAVSCWWRIVTLVELTYFWGLTGTIQGVLTPDLNVGFPHLVFFEYVAGHLGIVTAALFLVIGMRIVPRPGAVPRVFAITVAYTALVGAVDALTGANYMFLRRPPGEWTLLRLLGPWPWYLLGASAVAILLFTLLDMPFWPARRRGGPVLHEPDGHDEPNGHDGADGQDEPAGHDGAGAGRTLRLTASRTDRVPQPRAQP